MWNIYKCSIPLFLYFSLFAVLDLELINAGGGEYIQLPSLSDYSINLRVPKSCPQPDPKLNYRPVIGILSHPGDCKKLNTNTSCIPASYVKLVESAGARVIPIIFNQSFDIVRSKLDLVNGVLITGGGSTKRDTYWDTVEGIFQEVLKKNDAGKHFPLLAINVGFQLLTLIISKDYGILEKFRGIPSPLQFYGNESLDGTVFERFPPELITKLSTDCLVLQANKFGISPEFFQENSELIHFFRILTTSNDSANKVYVSTVQAHNYPVTAFQWQPEKNAFEWGFSNIPHTDDAVQVTQNVANYFVSEARKSKNTAPKKEVLNNLIYNYCPKYSGKAGNGYDQVYIFA